MDILDHNLYIPSINAYIDPHYPVDKAIITHAHADHAKPNHKSVLATEDTINIMKLRYGENCAQNFQIINYGERIPHQEIIVFDRKVRDAVSYAIVGIVHLLLVSSISEHKGNSRSLEGIDDRYHYQQKEAPIIVLL